MDGGVVGGALDVSSRAAPSAAIIYRAESLKWKEYDREVFEYLDFDY